MPDQIPARIVLFGIFLRRLLIDRQQAPALKINQVGRHHDEFAGHVDVQFLERLQILKVLLCDSLERNIVNVDLVALDQIKQEIERTLENFEPDFVIALHAARVDLENLTSTDA